MTPVSTRSAPPSPSNAADRRHYTSGGATSATSRLAFERALQTRSGQPDANEQGGTREIETTERCENPFALISQDRPPPAAAGVQASILHDVTASSASPHPAGHVSSTSATIERLACTAQHGGDSLTSTSITSANGASSWQATLGDPRGINIQLDVMREPAQSGRTPILNIDVALPAQQIATLNRFAGNLAERLQDRFPGRALRVNARHSNAGNELQSNDESSSTITPGVQSRGGGQ